MQRRLTSLGYHTGPVDGLYGPLTRSAVQWFQIKHGLRPTGVVAATTLAALREPTGFMQQVEAQAKQRAAPSRQASTPAASRQPQPAGQTTRGATPAWLVSAVVAALIVAFALLLTVVRPALRRMGARRARPVALPPFAPARRAATAPEEPAPGDAVLGYVPGGQDPRSEEDEVAIAEACRQRGWTLARLVREVQEASVPSVNRPGLRYALDQITQGVASRLVVHRLEHIARTLADLRAVLSWFMRAGVALTVLDVGLDTGTPEGRTAMRTLLSVCRSKRGREAAPTRAGAVAERVAGRPAVEDSPQLASRIREMRAGGMTLQAIADTLNREGVPTVRGGAEWRPSSVQSVLGYRRTRTQER